MACEPSAEDLMYYKRISELQLYILEGLILDAKEKDPEGVSESLKGAVKAFEKLKELTEENFRRLSPKKLPIAVKV